MARKSGPPRLYRTDVNGRTKRTFERATRSKESIRAQTRAQSGWPGRGNAAPGHDNPFLLNKKLRGSASPRESHFILPRSHVLLHFDGESRNTDNTMRDGTLQNAEDHGFFDP